MFQCYSEMLTVCTEESYLSLADMVRLYRVNKAWRREIQGRGFSYGVAWVCACLGGGHDDDDRIHENPIHLSNRIRRACPWAAQENMSVSDQIVRFLLRHEDFHGTAKEWAQLCMEVPKSISIFVSLGMTCGCGAHTHKDDAAAKM
jgi:hypothetical protein